MSDPLRCAHPRCLRPIHWDRMGQRYVHDERPGFPHRPMKSHEPVVSDGELYGHRRGRYGR